MKKILIGLSIAASIAAAGNIETGIAGGRSNVNNSPVENYNFLNLRLGNRITENGLLRAEYEISEKILNNKQRIQRGLLNYEYDYNNGSFYTPYTFIGGGYQWISGNYKNAYVADLGLGSKFSITDNVSWFAEIRGLRDFKNNDNHFAGMLGIVCGFGNNNKNEPAYQPVAVPKQPVTPKDSDNDGISDNTDKCPNTPGGVSVDKNGCPLDSDHDGVADYLDKCPNTPSGVSVDKNGCPVSFNFDITFAPNSSIIKSQYMNKIQEFAEFLKENPAYKAEIQGYTDNTGNKTYNILLSQKRAKAVYEKLIELGINKNRLSWTGFGPADPIAPNTTAEGKSANRRVIAKLHF